MQSIIQELANSAWFLAAANVLAVSATIIIMASFIRRTVRQPSLIAYRIGVIGLPRAGKTSLIGAIFAQIFEGRQSQKTKLSGSKTISRVNKIISALDQGMPVPPTYEGDTFVFRFIYAARNLLGIIPFKFEVEIADFPGEYSSDLLESAKSDMKISEEELILLDREYVGWLTNSRVILFVIEAPVALYSEGPRFRAETKAQIRATWQSLQELRTDQGLGGVRVRVCLVFTKCDALFTRYDPQNPVVIMGERQLGELEKCKADLEFQYKDLVKFLNADAWSVSIHFTSAYAHHEDGRLGISGLVSAIMP